MKEGSRAALVVVLKSRRRRTRCERGENGARGYIIRSWQDDRGVIGAQSDDWVRHGGQR